jgi:hypothetical protein
VCIWMGGQVKGCPSVVNQPVGTYERESTRVTMSGGRV